LLTYVYFYLFVFFFFLMLLRPPISTLFPYTTLFRSYFGFWAGSVAPAGSVIEQRGTVNFTMGGGPGPSADQAVAAGMKLMFFAPDFSDPNVQAQIDAMRPYAGNMLAFFTMDEPDCVANGDTARLDQLISSI